MTTYESWAIGFSIVAIIASVVSLSIGIPAMLNYAYKIKISKNSFHLTKIEKYNEETGEIFVDLVCMNFSIEPISLLRIDLVYGEDIQILDLEELLSASTEVNPSTLIPPREVRIFSKIKTIFKLEDLERIKESRVFSDSARVFTTHNFQKLRNPFNDPFVIDFKTGRDDSAPILSLKKQQRRKK